MSLVLCRPGIFFVLTFALLAQPAWGQRLGPLVKDNQQRSEASSAESTAAAVPAAQSTAEPPSARSRHSTAGGSRRFAAFATARG